MAYPPARYIRDWWSRSEYIRLRGKLISQLLERANLSLAGKGNISLLNEAGLAALIGQFESGVLSERLSVPSGKKRESFVAQLEALADGDNAYNDLRPLDAVKVLSRGLDLSEKQQRAALISVLDEKSGPADIFHLPSLPDLGHQALIVRLRSFSSIAHSEIGTSTAASAETSAKYIRCSRLADAVRFALIQKMAFLFSRIGMSTEYEADLSSKLKNVELDLLNEFFKESGK
jgi:hypothetical protein